MGYTPRQVREMSLWEFHQVVAGFSVFNGGGDSRGSEVTEDIYEAAIAAWYDESDARPDGHVLTDADLSRFDGAKVVRT